ncbi:Uncharacterised protein [Mycobacteroides abscessus subsp. abscessus]|nr:Uncharacterised protein [Mycobacteroides abscessus subsp. abscessus]
MLPGALLFEVRHQQTREGDRTALAGLQALILDLAAGEYYEVPLDREPSPFEVYVLDL